MSVEPAAIVAAIVVVVVVAGFALWWAESRELSNYERDEIPPPERTVSPQDWRPTYLDPKNDLSGWRK